MSDQDKPAAGAPAPLVEVWRGPIVESVHRGHLAAVDGSGEIVAELGSPEMVTYFRSSSKAFQAIPAVASGAADQFQFTEKEIALACGSHSGEPMHVETARAMLEKIGMDESALKCGAHEPFSVEVAHELIRKRQQPSALQNNCSGKHAAMLAFARHLGAPTTSYYQWDSPVQQEIAKVVAQFSDLPTEELKIGIDGCGVPVFGLPVRAMALAYARLVSAEDRFEPAIRQASRRVVAAMIRFPEMIGGSKDRLDTELIKAGKGRLISKIGAEGVYTVGVLPCPDWPRGLGLALKIDDGDDRRARPPAVIEALKQLRVLSDEDAQPLSDYSPIPITNRRGERTGEARAAFTLDIRRSRD
ncbi:MAG TPA: asparaginase [Pyrinomonadaceae bacterium]|nr:asparaginase [Pyrinomonadaceae bacterium]